jgi:hypothetical protein
MSLTAFIRGNKLKVFVLRLLSLYLILVFLFVSNYLETYHFLAFLNKPFIRVSAFLSQIGGSLFFNKKFTDDFEFRDYFQTYVALLFYLLIAIITTLIWTVADKGEKAARFFNYTWIFARYYLAAILLGYGISKTLGNQFGRPDLASMIQPFGDHYPSRLFWEFMGASKSYQIFGGLLETIAGLLLLFRRTIIMGCFLSFALLVNVLMLDIAYDTFVRIRVVYFIVLTAFILLPYLKWLFGTFILRRVETLPIVPPLLQDKKYKWLQYTSKFCLIILMVVVILRKQHDVYFQYHYPSQGSIAGIYKIQKFYLNGQLRQPVTNDTIGWDKIAINNHFAIMSIQLMSDSVAQYYFKADTLKKLIKIGYPSNPGFLSTLHYSINKNDEWLFEGTFKNDSVRFISKKIHKNFNLNKGYGEVIWDYGF